MLAEGNTKTIVTSDGTSESATCGDPEELGSSRRRRPTPSPLPRAARDELEPAPPAEPFEPDAVMQGELVPSGTAAAQGSESEREGGRSCQHSTRQVMQPSALANSSTSTGTTA